MDQFKNKKNENIYLDLKKQIDSIAKHNRQGSFKTKQRYYEGTLGFAKYVANEFQLRKFANTQDKHLESYINYMQEKGLSASTIKTNLSAVRFFFDKTNHKYELSDNSKFNLERRQMTGKDRAWSNEEYNTFKNQVCTKYNNQRAADIATLAKENGLRIHEAMRIRRYDALRSLQNGELHIKGKNGRERDIKLTEASLDVLKRKLEENKSSESDKLFVDVDQKTHLEIHKIQCFVNRHRDEFQVDSNREYNLSMHGLRHSYAQERFEYFTQEKELSELQAKLIISEELGHSRPDVVEIYLDR